MTGFGYNVLGFGAGGSASIPAYNIQYLVVAGGFECDSGESEF